MYHIYLAPCTTLPFNAKGSRNCSFVSLSHLAHSAALSHYITNSCHSTLPLFVIIRRPPQPRSNAFNHLAFGIPLALTSCMKRHPSTEQALSDRLLECLPINPGWPINHPPLPLNPQGSSHSPASPRWVFSGNLYKGGRIAGKDAVEASIKEGRKRALGLAILADAHRHLRDAQHGSCFHRREYVLYKPLVWEAYSEALNTLERASRSLGGRLGL